MAMLGQSSGGWLGSHSNLWFQYVNFQNSTNLVTDDSFTQLNPPTYTLAAAPSTVSTRVDTTVAGVLSGSVIFSRPDAGDNYVGGPLSAMTAAHKEYVRPLGIAVNSAVGNAYENLPTAASGKLTYVSGQGTFGNSLYETALLVAPVAGGAAGEALVYKVGAQLVASSNGYLMPLTTATRTLFSDTELNLYEGKAGLTATRLTTIGILKATPDSSNHILVYDQRI